MNWFIITALIMFIPCTLFGMMVTGNMSDKAPKWKRVTAFLLATTIASCVISGAFCLEESMNEDAWNNGYCYCGGKYEFKNADKGYRSTTTSYYYSCEECDHVIETTRQMR